MTHPEPELGSAVAVGLMVAVGPGSGRCSGSPNRSCYARKQFQGSEGSRERKDQMGLASPKDHAPSSRIRGHRFEIPS